MNKLNQKGQALVLFVCLLPMIILVLGAVVDIGYMVSEKRKLDNINQIAIQYAKSHLESEELTNEIISLIQKNDHSIENIQVFKEETSLEINLNKKIPSVMGKIIGLKNYQIVSEYQYDSEAKRIK